MGTYQVMQDASKRPLRSTGRKLYGKAVSLAPTAYSNGTSHRMPFAISRDLQPTAINGKELYFRVTDPGLKDVAHGGYVATGFDFELADTSGRVLPYVIKSYDPAAGTLMGVLNMNLLGSATATRGWLYFGNGAWTVSREDHANTFPNATCVLFLPSGNDESDSQLNMSGDLPIADITIVNPGAKCVGSRMTDAIERALVGNCGSFLISFMVQSTTPNSDNVPAFFGSGTGPTVIYMRHCYATPNGPHPATDITNCWRCGFSVPSGNVDYESAQDTADTSLQHFVLRRVLGSSLELYINGQLVPWAFTSEPAGVNLSQRIDFTGQKLGVGRGSVTGSRWWDGYLDCFKFYKDDPKSAAWIAAEYANLSEIDDAVIFGTPETPNAFSPWGEAVAIVCDQSVSPNVDFQADKYSAALSGVIALGSPKFPNAPSHGTLSDQGSNKVRYANDGGNATDDNTGTVKLTNGQGSVIIPVRAHIIVSSPPPPTGGYYKDPWDNTKFTSLNNVDVTGGRTDFLNKLATIKSTPGWTRSNYLRVMSDISGSTVDVDAGTTPTQSDPLVIMMPGAGTDSNWSSRHTISCKLRLKSKYTWLYGCVLDWASNNTHQFQNALLEFWNDWQFLTACRLIGSCLCRHDAGSFGLVSDLHINFNRCEMRPTVVGNNEYYVFISGGESGSGVNFKVAHPVTIARNYLIDAQGAIDANCDWIYCGDGSDPNQGHSVLDYKIEYNYAKANFKRAIYMKLGACIRWNHTHCILPNGSDSSAGIHWGFRGPTAAGGLCAYNRGIAGRTLMCHGPDHEFVSNFASGSHNRYNPSCLMGGAGKDTPAANNCKFIGNTGDMFLPWYAGNVDNPFGNLGTSGTFLIAGHNGAIREQKSDGPPNWNDLGDGPVISFDPVTGHPTGSHIWLTNSGVKKQDNIPAGYTMATPPTLNTTVTGPGAAGKVWGT